MKVFIILLIVTLGLFSIPAFADKPNVQSGLSYPGIKWEWKIKAENYTFIVTTVSNYDMQNAELDKGNKTLIFRGNSSHSENIAEIEIPHNLIGGNLTVFQEGKMLSPIIINGANSSTIMLKFNQSGLTTTKVVGTTYLPEFSGVASVIMVVSTGMILVIAKTRKF